MAKCKALTGFPVKGLKVVNVAVSGPHYADTSSKYNILVC